jgi:class 3 adenylate cyclase
MDEVRSRSLDEPHDVRSFPNGRLDLFNVGGIVMARTRFEPGWHWARDVQPLAGTASCRAHHVGVVLSGSLGVRMDDGGEFTIGPNSAYDIPPGHDGWVIGDEPWVTIDFIGMADFGVESEDDRVLVSILFTDIVESTVQASRLGDVAWRNLLERYNQEARLALERHRVRSVKDTGDGLMAIFDSPARALSTAIELSDLAQTHGLRLRAGIHTGEVQIGADDVRGVAVHEAARVMSAASGSQILVSSTTRALLSANPALHFDSRGMHELKGIDGERELFALERAS